MTRRTATTSALPGHDLIERGLEDLRAGSETVEALLVSIGAPRLRAAGFSVQPASAMPEHKLYELLSRQRIVGAGGEIKLRGNSAFEQRFRLESEGVTFRGKRVNMLRHEYKFPRAKAKFPVQARTAVSAAGNGLPKKRRTPKS